MKKIILAVSLFFIGFVGFSQQSVNDFKYVIIPSQFEWVNKPDKYQVNSLTKYLFEKYGGYNVVMSNDNFPEDLAKNRCLALHADVKSNSGFIFTKLFIELKDCYGNIVFTSAEGKSKEKQYKKAYHEAIRRAFESVRALNYKYNGKNNTPVVNTSTPTEPTVVASIPDIKQAKPENLTKPVAKIKDEKPSTKTASNVLYAQEMANGYQLVDTKPAVVFQILKSSRKDFYFLKNKNGILFKQGQKWIAEFYENNKLVQKQYDIKF